jgi:polar amino acid transport system substrate-binding protein
MIRNKLILLLALLAAIPGYSAEDKQQVFTEYIIGVTHAPPYVIIEGNQVSGAAVYLWKDVADSLGLHYRFLIFNNLDSLLAETKAGRVDLILTPRTITRERMKSVTLSVPFMTSRAGALVKEGREYPIIRVFKNMVTRSTLKIYGVAFLFIFIFAFLMWIAERKKNPAMFHPSHRGVFDGIWWATITMATVGYGDTVPKSVAGRVIAMLWILYAISLLFLITSEVSSELTVAKLELRSVGVRELRDMKTITIEKTGYADALTINRVRHTQVKSVVLGVEEVWYGKYDVFVFDRAILQYVLDLKNQDHKLLLLPTDLNEQYLCFTANKEMTGLMDNINPVILQAIQTLRWKETLVYYNIPQ